MLVNNGEAREYLARVMPWPDEGTGQDGYCNVHWTTPRREDPTRNFWSGRGCRTPDELIRQFEWVATRFTDAQNFYVCMSRQRLVTEKTSKAGKTYLQAERSSAAAIALKSFFLDVDFKQYADAQEAYAALKAFILAVGLPKPSVLVLTGGGLHVYWTIDRNMAPAEWAPLAHALVAAAQKHGLKFDSACTVDAARILRIPGTQNFKYTPPRDVSLLHCSQFDYTLDRIEQPLHAFVGMVQGRAVPAASFPLPAKPPLGPSELAAGIETLPPLPPREVFKECGFYRHGLFTGGADYANPLWHLGVLGTTWLDKGREIAHRISSGHAGYTAEETDALFDRKLRDRKERNIGYPSCAAVQNAGSSFCAACPHLAKGKSPLNLATLPTPPKLSNGTAALLSAVSQPLPPGYSRNAAGLICKETADDDGNTSIAPICALPILNAHLSKSTEEGYMLYFNTELDCATEIKLSTSLAGVLSEMRKTVQGQGFMLQDEEVKPIGRFFVSWIKELQAHKEAVTSATPFGWSYNGNKLEGFVYDSRVWTTNGTKPAAAADNVLAHQYSPHGDVAPWVAAAAMITDQQRPGLEAVIASSFAAPLVAFVDQPGLLMSLYSSESGIGKTTAIRVAQAVWGDPMRAVQALSDTQNSVINKLGKLQSLPVYWDEMRTPEDGKAFLFQLAQGKEKSRLTQQAQQREPGQWHTMLVVASNESLLNLASQSVNAASASTLRVFEYELAPANGHGQISTAEASRIVGKLNQNHGQIGLQYAQWLGKHHEQVRQEMGAALQLVEYETSAVPEERFWTATVAVIEVAARYANALGFTKIDEPALNAFMRGQFLALRGEHSGQPTSIKDIDNAGSVFGNLMQDIRRNTLPTNISWANRSGRPKKDEVTSLVPHLQPMLGPVYAQVSAADKVVIISKKIVDDWLKEHGHNGKMILDAWRANFGMERRHLGIAAGVPNYATPQQYVYMFDGNKHQNAARLLAYLQP